MAGAGSYEVGTILARLGLDPAGFKKGLAQAESDAKAFIGRINKELSKLKFNTALGMGGGGPVGIQVQGIPVSAGGATQTAATAAMVGAAGAAAGTAAATTAAAGFSSRDVALITSGAEQVEGAFRKVAEEVTAATLAFTMPLREAANATAYVIQAWRRMIEFPADLKQQGLLNAPPAAQAERVWGFTMPLREEAAKFAEALSRLTELFNKFGAAISNQKMIAGPNAQSYGPAGGPPTYGWRTFYEPGGNYPISKIPPLNEPSKYPIAEIAKQATFAERALNLTRNAIDGVKSGFTTLGKWSTSVFNAIGWAASKTASAVTWSFGKLRDIGRWFSPLKLAIGGLLGGLTIKNLIETANRAEKLAYGFDHLSQKIGAVSSTFLPRLRTATKGTISDMDLMENANAAILLGASKTEDQFVELAEGARRLGQAMGIDVGYALKSLSYGIGRQSRLWLDNLGIIVQAGEAQKNYASAIGKTVDQLTNTEKSQAFAIAAMDAMREAVDELGPDVRLTANAWEQMQATFVNTWAAIGRAIVGSDIPDAITSFLKENQRTIIAWAKYIVNTVKDIFNGIKSVFTDKSGAFTTKSLFAGLTEVITAGIKAAINIAIPTSIDAVTKIAPGLILVITAIVAQIVHKGIIMGIKTAAQYAVPLLAPVFGLLKEEVDKFINEALDPGFFKDAANKLSGASGGVLGTGVEELFENFKEYSKKATAEFGKDLGISAERSLKTRLTFEFDKIDPMGGASRIVLNKFIQPLADGLEKIQKLRETLSTGGQGEIVKAIFGDTGTNKEIENLTKNLRVLQELKYQGFAVDELEQFTLNLIRAKEAANGVANAKAALFQWKIADWAHQIFGNPRVIIATGEAIRLAGDALASFGKKFAELMNRFFGQRRPFNDILVEAGQAMEDLQQKASLANIPVGLEEYGVLIKKLRELDDAIVAAKNDYNLWWMQLVRAIPGVDAAAKKMITWMEARSKAAKGAAWEAFSTVKMAEFKKEIVSTNRSLEATNEIMAKIDNNEFVDEETIRYVAEMNVLIELFAEETKASADEVAKLRDRLEDVGRIRSLQKLKDEVKEFKQSIADAKWDLEDFNPMRNYEDETATAIRKRMDQLKNSNVEIQREIEAAKNEQLEIATNPALYSLVGEGNYNELLSENETYIKNKQQIQDDQKRLINDLVSEYDQALNVSFRKLNQAMVKEISTSIGEGIVDGYLRGEKASKIWANIATDIFRKQMSKAIDDIGNMLGKAFDAALGSYGGLANVALGAVALGVSILGAIKNRKESQVEDFAEAINSSEAMRGVVAGPTNVAIAKMGDSLKFALATTEVLLSRIATGIDKIAGTGEYASGPGVKNMAVRLSPSSAS